MNPEWTTPSFVEVAMNAEVGSYQEDGGGDDEWVRPAEQRAATPEPEPAPTDSGPG